MILPLLMAMAAVISSAPPPMPAGWALETELRDAYVHRVAAAHVLVEYVEGGGEFSDPGLQPVYRVSGFVGLSAAGAPTIYTAGSPVGRATRFWVRFGDGQRHPARLQPGGDPWDRVLAELVPEDAGILAGRPALSWAPSEQVVAGLAGWVVETVPSLTPDGRPGRVLVDTAVGATVEPPLTHLRYVSLTRANGLPVLDASGAVLCVIFRGSPIHEGLSLCAPGTPAGGPPEPRRTPMEVTP